MPRRILLAGAICALVAVAAVAAIHGYSHGPGLEGELTGWFPSPKRGRA